MGADAYPQQTFIVSGCGSGKNRYSQLLYNFGVSLSDVASESTRCSNVIQTCCQNKCNSKSNECYNKCVSELW